MDGSGRGCTVDVDVPWTWTCRGRGRAVDADAARTRTPADTDAARTRTHQTASGRGRARTRTCHGHGRHSDADFLSVTIFSRDTIADRADSAADGYAKSVADGSSGQADAVMSLLSDDEVMPPRRPRSVGSLPTADVMGHSGLIKTDDRELFTFPMWRCAAETATTVTVGGRVRGQDGVWFIDNSIAFYMRWFMEENPPPLEPQFHSSTHFFAKNDRERRHEL